MQYRTKDNDTLDAICWNYYGQQSGTVEAVLKANPGLADLGAKLPAGIVIQLPQLTEPSQLLNTVKLWD